MEIWICIVLVDVRFQIFVSLWQAKDTQLPVTLSGGQDTLVYLLMNLIITKWQSNMPVPCLPIFIDRYPTNYLSCVSCRWKKEKEIKQETNVDLNNFTIGRSVKCQQVDKWIGNSRGLCKESDLKKKNTQNDPANSLIVLKFVLTLGKTAVKNVEWWFSSCLSWLTGGNRPHGMEAASRMMGNYSSWSPPSQETEVRWPVLLHLVD